jgi:hypothetical protein
MVELDTYTQELNRMVSEVFNELDFDDAAEALQRRNDRLLELQAQGMVCTHEDLYRVDGRRVYMLTATPPSASDHLDEGTPRLKPRGGRPVRPTPKFETR